MTNRPRYSKDDVLALAGAKSYERGLQYLDAVDDLEADDTGVYATVEGTDFYAVRLHLIGNAGGLAGECDCPWGEEGNFCKHCVAVALVYLNEIAHGGVPRRTDLRPHLETLDHGELVELLLTAAETSREIRRHLADHAAAAAAAKS